MSTKTLLMDGSPSAYCIFKVYSYLQGYRQLLLILTIHCVIRIQTKPVCVFSRKTCSGVLHALLVSANFVSPLMIEKFREVPSLFLERH